MYLFSRNVRLGAGNPEKQIAWALKITEKVNQLAAAPVNLWTTVFSPDSGRLVWTSLFEDLVTIETTMDKLIADPGYVSLVEEGSAHASGDPVDDGLLQFVFADPEGCGARGPVRGSRPHHVGARRHCEGHSARGGDRTARGEDHRDVPPRSPRV